MLTRTQQTIICPVSYSGVGIHSGDSTSFTCHPAPIGAGIRFRRVDIDDAPEIPATIHALRGMTCATTLGHAHTAIHTVEHVLSAITALEISNLFIEVNGPEIPASDGSASEFVNLLLTAGIRAQSQAASAYRMRRSLTVRDHDRVVHVEPYDGLKITYSIDFPNAFIGRQTRTFDGNREQYIHDIAPARTFCLAEQLPQLRKLGLSQGGSLHNAVVFAHDKILNGTLRFPDESVRHKILDALGDFALLGRPLLGHITIHKGSHKLHTDFIKALHAHPDHWEEILLE